MMLVLGTLTQDGASYLRRKNGFQQCSQKYIEYFQIFLFFYNTRPRIPKKQTRHKNSSNFVREQTNKFRAHCKNYDASYQLLFRLGGRLFASSLIGLSTKPNFPANRQIEIIDACQQNSRLTRPNKQYLLTLIIQLQTS